jgi:hypothetical protein
MQMARERAPHGFTDIDDIIERSELEEVAAAYKRVAGFDPAVLNDRASWTPTGHAV